jgi:hypothetical protein
MYTQYLYHIHPPTPFPHHLYLPLVPPPLPRQDLFYPPEEKIPVETFSATLFEIIMACIMCVSEYWE